MKAVGFIAIFLAFPAPGTFAAEEKSTLSLTIENDSFFGTDRYYTHGFRLQYLHRPNDMPDWTARFLTNFPTFGMEVSRKRYGFALGQELFTPADIAQRALNEQDRPYGAWLHGSVIFRRSGMLAQEIPVMDEIEIDVGVVGPEALGEDTQKWWHGVTDYAEPRGWGHQLATEPALQLYLNRSIEMRFPTESYWSLSLAPHVRAALGNIYIFGEAGAFLRAGYNLPAEYVVSPMESYSTHPAYSPPSWSMYVFAGADGRVVGRNVFLDGNLFEESHSVEKELWVADLRVGGAVRYEGVEMVVSIVHRTREFQLQTENETFMSVNFQLHF